MAKMDTFLTLFLFGFLSVESLRIDPPKIKRSGKFFAVSDLPNFTPNDPRCVRNGLFSNPLDCTAYFACIDGQGQDRKCPEGMKFHPIKHCTLDEDVECNGEASLSSNSEENLECPEDYGMFVYPGDCHKYVFCVERIPELLDCPNKQVYQHNVGCVEGKECPKVQSSVDGSEQSEKCLLPPENGPCKAKVIRYYYDVNTGRCKKFFYGGCQGNGNNFETMLKCELACFSQPEDGIGICRSSNSIHRDPTDCRRYTRCIDFIPHLSRCPAGEGYSSKTNGCVNLKDSDCKTNSVIDIMDI